MCNKVVVVLKVGGIGKDYYCGSIVESKGVRVEKYKNDDMEGYKVG